MADDGAIWAWMLCLRSQKRGDSLKDVQAALAAMWREMEQGRFKHRQ